MNFLSILLQTTGLAPTARLSVPPFVSVDLNVLLKWPGSYSLVYSVQHGNKSSFPAQILHNSSRSEPKWSSLGSWFVQLIDSETSGQFLCELWHFHDTSYSNDQILTNESLWVRVRVSCPLCPLVPLCWGQVVHGRVSQWDSRQPSWLKPSVVSFQRTVTHISTIFHPQHTIFMLQWAITFIFQKTLHIYYRNKGNCWNAPWQQGFIIPQVVFKDQPGFLKPCH